MCHGVPVVVISQGRMCVENGKVLNVMDTNVILLLLMEGVCILSRLRL